MQSTLVLYYLCGPTTYLLLSSIIILHDDRFFYSIYFFFIFRQLDRNIYQIKVRLKHNTNFLFYLFGLTTLFFHGCN